MKLHSQASSAKLCITQKSSLTNALELAEIRIYRLSRSSSPAQIQAHGKDPMEFTNQWFLDFTFNFVPEHDDLDFRDVVMLLDGTYATEKKVPLRAAAHAPAPLGQGPPLATPDWSVFIDPMGDVLTNNFVPSEVQWNPMLSEFPLDISEQTARARTHLVSATNMPSDFVLHEMYIQRYLLPVEVLRALGADPEKHRHHWVLIFVFGRPTNKQLGKEYFTYILLDQRIVATTVRPWGGRPTPKPAGG